MSHFDRVTEVWGALRYMDEPRARFMRDIIDRENCEDLLEIGFWKGKSSAYFAAILEDRGRGHLTTIDRKKGGDFQPRIEEVLTKVGLAHRVTPIHAHRSYSWILARMLEKQPRPVFDFCYFDGGHTWDNTALGLLLVEMLLRPGGILVVDDLNWTIDASIARTPSLAKKYASYSPNERRAHPVKMAWDHIVPRLGFENLSVEPAFHWGIARKPALA
ncbi:MAG: hypothetical protein DI556_03740 [Rhodovulum sulfidophilum]|uniref:Class I SAM-dependent methyltransferase n=1 Tax=Rhodovulum sulfidophilum TaxID=35806 RepID=A0A2W5NDT7_RHOSU|nr:MAG: hypothetical protein DI556_03740 [Rhodovulum sulfidophilum]